MMTGLSCFTSLLILAQIGEKEQERKKSTQRSSSFPPLVLLLKKKMLKIYFLVRSFSDCLRCMVEERRAPRRPHLDSREGDQGSPQTQMGRACPHGEELFLKIYLIAFILFLLFFSSIYSYVLSFIPCWVMLHQLIK